MRILAALVIFSLAACVSPSGPVSVTPKADLAWEDALVEHTRAAKSWDYAVLEADLRATLVTPRLRRAFIDDRARFHGATAEKFADELLLLGVPNEDIGDPPPRGPTAEQQVIVFACLYVRDLVNRHIDAGYTIWDTRLVRGDARVAPMQIDKIRYSPALKKILPFADRFDEIYVLRFPLIDPQTQTAMLSPAEPALELHIDSAIAKLATKWELGATR